MFERDKIQFYLHFIYSNVSKRRRLDRYFEKVSFNIKFFLFQIINQRG